MRHTVAAFVALGALTILTAGARTSSHAVVTVHATDFAFEAPPSIVGGSTTFRLVNDGKALHQVSLIQLTGGKTAADYAFAVKGNKPTPWAVGAGGPSAAAPGQTVEATVTLEPGRYVLVCWAPAPRGQSPHMTALSVTPPSAASVAASEPTPDVRLDLSDYAFTFSTPITAGRHVIRVVNTGAQQHEAVFVKLPDGTSVKDVATWLETGMKGRPTAEVAPGMSGLGRTRAGTFTADFTPGRYGVLCAITDERDGRLHTAHGMMYEFTVAKP